MRWRRFDFFNSSRPRKVKGGIKAKSRRGAFGKSWWARRWIETLESFSIGARLGRGRSYARSGQVTSIRVRTGKIVARVQGSRLRPYAVEITVEKLTRDQWQAVVAQLAEQALFAAKLMAGEMPQDIERIFTAADLSLFPERADGLETDCTCPDWSNPCKHIAAVYYLLGEEFDRDPFLIFRLRGMEKKELLDQLKSIGGKRSSSRTAVQSIPAEPKRQPPPEPLPPDQIAFWKEHPLPDELLGEVRVPPVSAALPRGLGHFPFWRGNQPFLEALAQIYDQASPRGLNLVLGGNESGREPD